MSVTLEAIREGLKSPPPPNSPPPPRTPPPPPGGGLANSFRPPPGSGAVAKSILRGLGPAIAAWAVIDQFFKVVRDTSDLIEKWRAFLTPPAPTPDYESRGAPPFEGGQGESVEYYLEIGISTNNSAGYDPPNHNYFVPVFAYGPIGGMRITLSDPSNPYVDEFILELWCKGCTTRNPDRTNYYQEEPGWYFVQHLFQHHAYQAEGTAAPFYEEILNISRRDGEPDLDGNPQGQSEIVSPPPPPRVTINNEYVTNNTTVIERYGTSFVPDSVTKPPPPAQKPEQKKAPIPIPTPQPDPFPPPKPISEPDWIFGPTVKPPPKGPEPIIKPPPPKGPEPDVEPTVRTSSDVSEKPSRAFPPPLIFGPPGLKIGDGSKTGRDAVRQPEKQVTQTQPSSCKQGCTGKILSGQEAINDNLQQTVNNVLQGADLSLLGVINNKLGDQLPNGGISGFMRRAWKNLHINKVLDLLNTALLIHNAAMLSRNLTASIGDVVSGMLNNVATLLNDEWDERIDINETIGNTVEGFLKSIIGEQNYNDVRDTFRRYNRILNAAANIISIVEASFHGIAEGLELLGKYTGKVGNALKRSGAILESSVEWFSDKFQVRVGRAAQFQRVLDGLESVENIASDLEQVTSEFREVQENFQEFEQQKQEIQDAIATREQEIANKQALSKASSQGADIAIADTVKPAPTP